MLVSEPNSAALPSGATYDRESAVTYFRVWAPERNRVTVVFDERSDSLELDKEQGFFSGTSQSARPGTRYRYQLDGGGAYPDPASRFQPEGPHGSSEIVDPHQFAWTDSDWAGVRLKGQVIYELHLGTFTEGGTWLSAAERLPYLRDTGVTLVEVMPVAEFPGRWGWGYDGVQLFAPASIYGRPDDMRAFVDAAHALGIGVILDVVYNHLGPDGNYLAEFSPYYFSRERNTDWGRALNFDGSNNGPVRDYFIENAGYWIREFHLDGLRFDATQDIHDHGAGDHILQEIVASARSAAKHRSILLVGENEPQHTNLIRPVADGGYGLDALWNDDYHHSATVAMTGKSDAYYTDYRGAPQELISVAKYGYLYQGQRYKWQKQPRGASTLGLPRASMINFIQNHDQVANSARGQRIHELSSPGVYKALTALTLLIPGTPMLFQGQEFGSSSRFLYFVDHKPELNREIKEGRAGFLHQWRSLGLPEMRGCLTDPGSPRAFEQSRLDHAEVNAHAETYLLHQDLLRLRRQDPVISMQGEAGIDGATLAPQAFLLRYFSPGFQTDRLLLVNLGVDLQFDPAPEPLLAPPAGTQWVKLWSSDDPQYGGCGTAPLDTEENWRIPGQAAVLLHPVAG